MAAELIKRGRHRAPAWSTITQIQLPCLALKLDELHSFYDPVCLQINLSTYGVFL